MGFDGCNSVAIDCYLRYNGRCWLDFVVCGLFCLLGFCGVLDWFGCVCCVLLVDVVFLFSCMCFVCCLLVWFVCWVLVCLVSDLVWLLILVFIYLCCFICCLMLLVLVWMWLLLLVVCVGFTVVCLFGLFDCGDLFRDDVYLVFIGWNCLVVMVVYIGCVLWFVCGFVGLRVVDW